MISVDNKVKNIYYMLCYSFNGKLLNEKDESLLGDEAYDNIYNLFSMLLCLVLNKQIKKGIYRNYNNKLIESSVIRGKINLNASFKANTIINKKLICEYDEYNENCLLNKVIKTTILYLLKSDKIGNNTKDTLKKLNLYFYNVDTVDIKNIKWDMIKFNRNNLSYKFVTDLCKLILNKLIVSDKKGNNKYKEFLDDTDISAIYENFIKSYYRKHYPELNALSRKLHLTSNSDANSSLIPMMKTDITLEYDNRILIIDAKFYSKIIRDGYYKSKVINSGHLYQILAYVDNLDPQKKGNAEGMLLYAQTIDEPNVSISDVLNGHRIYVRTLDMNDEWNNIKYRLNTIADSFKNSKLND